MFRWLLYRRWFTVRVMALLEYLMLDLLFAGGFLFSMIERIYLRTFDSSQRMKRTRERIENDSRQGAVSPDWENPAVVGRHRRRAHAPLHSFASRQAALCYFEKSASDNRRNELVRPNIMMLTGRCGSPDSSHGWQFCLVGDPFQAPLLWNTTMFTPSECWHPIALPGHWQLQGEQWCGKNKSYYS